MICRLLDYYKEKTIIKINIFELDNMKQYEEKRWRRTRRAMTARVN